MRERDGTVVALDVLRALAQAETGLPSVELSPLDAQAFDAAALVLRGGLAAQTDPVGHFFQVEDTTSHTWEGLPVVASEVATGACLDTLISLDLRTV